MLFSEAQTVSHLQLTKDYQQDSITHKARIKRSLLTTEDHEIKTLFYLLVMHSGEMDLCCFHTHRRDMNNENSSTSNRKGGKGL